MTKKSASRLLRDQNDEKVKDYFNTNKVFDELNDIHVKIVAQIKSFGFISQLSKNQALIDRLDDKSDVNQKTKLLAADLQKIIANLNENYSFHKDKTGGASNADEYMNALIAFQNYQQITMVIDGTIIPTTADLLEDFSKAERKLKAETESENKDETPSESSSDEKPLEATTH